jgi:hypothetical protein
MIPIVQLNITLPVSGVLIEGIPTLPGRIIDLSEQEMSTELNKGLNLNWTNIFLVLYFPGAIFFLARFAFHLLVLRKTIRQNTVLYGKGYKLVLVDTDVNPHTFFKYIFLNDTKYMAGKYPQSLILHEVAHSEQGHSLDRVFLEVVQALFWYNPLIILYKNALKTVHEFQADKSALEAFKDEKKYKEDFLEMFYKGSYYYLSSKSTYSIIKKRIVMLNKKKNTRFTGLRIVTLVPVVAFLIIVLNLEMTNGYPSSVAFYESENLAQSELQERVVTGTVRDAITGQPMIGVAVLISNSARGTISNKEGNYTIHLQANDSILVFNYIGYNPVYMPVSEDRPVDVLMVKEGKPMTEIERQSSLNKPKKDTLAGSVRSETQPSRLFIVDGKRVTQDQYMRVHPVLIKSSTGYINIPKDSELYQQYKTILEKYPEEATVGVMIITLKDMSEIHKEIYKEK